MKIQNTHIPDLLLIQPQVHFDERGYFMESYQKEKWRGVCLNWVQENESFSQKNVLRGLHYQVEFPQAKLVRCAMGSILDVVVDLRKDSPTYLQHYKAVLSSENKHQLFIPKGFAHGFYALSDAIVIYKTDEYYHPESERTIHYKDPLLNIDWQLRDTPIISAKDTEAPFLKEK